MLIIDSFSESILEVVSTPFGNLEAWMITIIAFINSKQEMAFPGRQVSIGDDGCLHGHASRVSIRAAVTTRRHDSQADDMVTMMINVKASGCEGNTHIWFLKL